MHALLARIDPSYRRAFVAWLIIRGLLWATLAYHGTGLPHAGLQLPWELGPGVEPGAPLWVGLQHACNALGATLFGTPTADSWLLVATCEAALLMGAISVYRFVRSETLPHTAERATWLWLALPAAAITLPSSAWSLTAGFAAAALAAIARSRPILGSLMLAVATGFRPEALLVWPGAVWFGLRKRPGDTPALGWSTLSLGLIPPAAFTTSVATTLLAAGDWGISLRSLQPHARWRSELPWWQLTGHSGLLSGGFQSSFPAIATAAGALLLLTITLTQAKKFPLSWLAIGLPAIAWPLSHQPPTAAAAGFLLALPAFAALGRVTDNRVLERALLAICLAGLALAALG